MSEVFISYPQQAEKDAASLSKALEAKGIKSWYASRDLPAGEPANEKIEGAMQQADAVVFLVTPDTERSSWMRQESSVALESYWRGETKLLIPVLIGPGAEAPGFLRQWNSLTVNKKSDWAHVAEHITEWAENQDTVRNQPSTEELAERRNRLQSIDKQVLHWRKAGASSAKKPAAAPARAAKPAMRSGVKVFAAKKSKSSKAAH